MKKLLPLFLSIVFMTVFIEGAMRVLFKISDKDIDVYRNFSFEREANIFMPGETLSYKLIPRACRNAFTSDFQIVYCTNSIGLREKELENTSKLTQVQ